MRGSLLYGARFNIKGYFGALYTSLTPDTAGREIARYFTVPPIGGFELASIRLHLTRVLDLTRPNSLARAGISDEQLIASQYSVTQEIGLSAWENGFEGLITPSAAIPGQHNLAVFLDNQQPSWRIELTGRSELFLPVEPA
jgi:RES domain-containing protein